MNKKYHHNRIILAIFCIAPIINKLSMTAFFPIFSDGHIFMPDSSSYIAPAESLWKSGHFSTNWENPQNAEMTRTPGYPVFLALIFFIFGQNYFTVIFFQWILCIITTLIIYVISSQFFGGYKPLIPVIIYVLDPVSFTFSNIVLSETLFSVLIVLFAFYSIKIISRRPIRLFHAVIAGLFLALSTLTRPVTSYLFIILLAMYCVYAYFSDISKQLLVKIIIGFSLPWLIFVVGWQVRNYQLSGSFRLSNIEPINLLTYRAAGVIAIRDNLPLSQAQESVLSFLPKKSETKDTYSDYYRIAFKIISDHPILFVRSQLNGLAKLMLDSGSDDLLSLVGITEPTGLWSDIRTMPTDHFISKWSQKPVYMTFFILCNLYLIAFYYLVIRGIYSFFRENQYSPLAPTIFLIIIVLYFIVFSAGPESDARFRLPIIPVLAILSGLGFSNKLSGNIKPE